MDMGSITAAVTGLKTAADITKGFLDLKGGAEVQGKVIELQGVILAAQTSALAAQSDQFSLNERVRELEEKMASLEAWNAEKERYELTDFGGETFAYLVDENMRGAEPVHRICAHCYQQGYKSILQFRFSNTMSQDVYICPNCTNEFSFGHPKEPQIDI